MTEYFIVAPIAVAGIGVYGTSAKRCETRPRASPLRWAAPRRRPTLPRKSGIDAGRGAVAISNQAAGMDNFTNEAKKK